MLRARVSRETRCVRRNEREGCFFIGPVLSQNEMRAADEVPGGISPFQKLLQRLLRIGEFRAASRFNFFPQRGEYLGVQILPARHRRCGVRQFRQHFRRASFDGANRSGAYEPNGLRGRAQHGDLAAGKIPPICKICGQSRTDLANPKLEQPVSGTALKRSLQTIPQIVRLDARFIRRDKHGVSLRREHRNSIRVVISICGFSWPVSAFHLAGI